MSIYDKRAAIGAVLATASCLAMAGMGQTTGSVPSTDPCVTIEPDQDRIQLRCWQHGRLLFDTRTLEDMPSVAGSRLALKARTGDGPLQVVDLGETVCLVLPKSAGRPAPGG